jgi:N-acyl-D-aspartate/D-glutamate deacylase
MGDRASEAPTANDIAMMQRTVVDGLRSGALGMSFGRTAGHKSASGVDGDEVTDPRPGGLVRGPR